MKSQLFFLLFFLFTGFSFSQNLVPNPGFEEHVSCPNSQDQIQFAIGWSKYSETSTTPDYYNSCATPGDYGVPNCYGGFQEGHNNSNAFAALVTFAITSVNYREHIGIPLNQTLVIGQKYFLSLYAVMSEASGLGTPSNNIGLRLSTVAFDGSHPVLINNLSHVNLTSILNDSVNWNRVVGSMVADSAYKYLVIGNFYDDNNTDTIQYSGASRVSYYYIDDICVSTDSLLCSSPQAVNGNVNLIESAIKMFPNPVSDFLSLVFPKSLPCKINLFDSYGIEIQEWEILEERNITLNLQSLFPNIYFIRITFKENQEPVIKKIIKL